MMIPLTKSCLPTIIRKGIGIPSFKETIFSLYESGKAHTYMRDLPPGEKRARTRALTLVGVCARGEGAPGE